MGLLHNPFWLQLVSALLSITFQFLKLPSLAKDHWWGFITWNAHIVHIFNYIRLKMVYTIHLSRSIFLYSDRSLYMFLNFLLQLLFDYFELSILFKYNIVLLLLWIFTSLWIKIWKERKRKRSDSVLWQKHLYQQIKRKTQRGIIWIHV